MRMQKMLQINAIDRVSMRGYTKSKQDAHESSESEYESESLEAATLALALALAVVSVGEAEGT